jgi:fibronectin type 3 domain-containing protein
MSLPLNPSPLAAPPFEVAGAELGAERCFAVRSVQVVATVPLEGASSPGTCVTPRDIFPPATPQGLSLLVLDGAVELVWDAGTEQDLSGYTVLRAEAPGDTLRPITPAPIRETSFRDTTVKSGVRYIYAIVAVDRTGNASPQSPRVEGTAR